MAASEIEGVSMCDEIHDARLRVFWRSLAEESELEREEEIREIEPLIKVQPPELPKASRKALVR